MIYFIRNYIVDTSFFYVTKSFEKTKTKTKKNEKLENRAIKFLIKKNNVFVLYLSQRIVFRHGDSTQVDMKTLFYIPDEIVPTCTLLPTFQQNGSKLKNNKYIPG